MIPPGHAQHRYCGEERDRANVRQRSYDGYATISKQTMDKKGAQGAHVQSLKLAQSAVACFHIQICPETALNQSDATCDVLQRCAGFRLIYLHYSSVQNKLEFKLASLSALEDKIQHRERERGGLDDQARQKVPNWTCLQSLALTTM